MQTRTQNTITTEASDKTTVSLYVPRGAAVQPLPERLERETVMDHLKLRACERADGFTAFEATGGWQNDGEIIEEDVTVLQVHMTDGDRARQFAEEMCHFIKEYSTEEMVLATVGGVQITVV